MVNLAAYLTLYFIVVVQFSMSLPPFDFTSFAKSFGFVLNHKNFNSNDLLAPRGSFVILPHHLAFVNTFFLFYNKKVFVDALIN